MSAEQIYIGVTFIAVQRISKEKFQKEVKGGSGTFVPVAQETDLFEMGY